MPLETYRERIADSRHPRGVRQRLVQHYLERRSVSLTARAFRCDRKTVRLWVQRYQQGGGAALLDRRSHHSPPHKTAPAIEREVVRLHRRNPRLGQDKIQVFLTRRGVHLSTATINRILHAYALIKPRRKRWQRRRLATEVRKTMRAFQKLQVDTKHLDDLPALLPAIQAKRLPGYEYTAKDVATGIAYVCLAYEGSEINSLRFVHLLFQHLLRHGVDVHHTTVQTDNGSEFLGHPQAKRTSAFTRLVEQRYGARHTTIPVAAPRFNGVVENFHGRVEDEFYTLEPLPTEEEMLERLFGYILYYNFGRPNEGSRHEDACRGPAGKGAGDQPRRRRLPTARLGSDRPLRLRAPPTRQWERRGWGNSTRRSQPRGSGRSPYRSPTNMAPQSHRASDALLGRWSQSTWFSQLECWADDRPSFDPGYICEPRSDNQLCGRDREGVGLEEPGEVGGSPDPDRLDISHPSQS